MKADFDYPQPYGTAVEITSQVRLLLCSNPSPMTFKGTNTYLVGTKDLAVIDPGPQNDTHLNAILGALTPEQTITHIIVTHSHLDHSPLARPLSDATGAEILAFGDAVAGRSKIMQEIAAQGLAGGGEGIDHDFQPDRNLSDGDVVAGSDWQLEVIHTPGHLGNHISLALDDLCFTGDHVMGWASSLVSPPDGDLSDFMTSCDRLLQRQWRAFLPGHGAPVCAPDARLRWLVEHRRAREGAILNELSKASATVFILTRAIYTETPPALLPAAERNVFAHLVDLHQKKRVSCRGSLGFASEFSRLS